MIRKAHLKPLLTWKTSLFLFIIAALALSSCEKEEEEDSSIRVVPRAFYNNEPLEFGALYTENYGYTFRIDGFKTYLSNVSIEDEEGNSYLIRGISLIDFDDPSSWVVEIPQGKYNKLNFSVGVPENLNKDNDPAAYENNHPLSVYGSAGMFWSWNSGYIFIKFEGKANLEGEDTPIIDPFAFHVGEDFLYRSHEENISICLGEDQQTIYLDFHTDQFLGSGQNSIDIATDNITHTSGNVELAERFVSNFNNAIEVN